MLSIIKVPDEILRKPCGDIPDSDVNHHVALANEMLALMHQSGGIGLAAPQVGISKNLFVVQLPEQRPYIFINPLVFPLLEHGFQKTTEGCLSIPNVLANVVRAKTVSVIYLDENHKVVWEKFEGTMAIVVQHEYDHLYGRLITDYADM